MNPNSRAVCSLVAIGAFSFFVIRYTHILSTIRIKPELIELYKGQKILAEDFTKNGSMALKNRDYV